MSLSKVRNVYTVLTKERLARTVMKVEIFSWEIQISDPVYRISGRYTTGNWSMKVLTLDKMASRYRAGCQHLLAETRMMLACKPPTMEFHIPQIRTLVSKTI